MADAAKRPIIVIKKKISGGGHHGGAWKVAYADFVTAMMSLFIVLWLLNSTPQVKKAVAGYFNDPKGSGAEMGSAQLGSGESVSIDTTNVTKLKEEIQKAILKQTDLSNLSKQVELTITSEGLRIELIEDKGGTFFQSGSPKLSDTGVKLLDMLALQLKDLPNHLLIEGHTDAQPFSDDATYTNWELSSDRANAARRLLQKDGVGQDHISQVRGYADQSLRVPTNPLDASNRRISVIVQWVDAPKGPEEKPGAEGKPEAGKEGAKAATEPGAAKKEEAPEGKSDAKGKAEETKSTTPAAEKPAVESAAPAEAKPTAAASKPAAGKTAAPEAKPSMMTRLKAMIPGKKK